MESKNNSYNEDSLKIIELSNNIKIRLAFIPAGNFLMGQSDFENNAIILAFGRDWHEKWCKRELPQHPVFISNDFFISVSPITVEQFSVFVEDTGYMTDSENAGWSYIWKGLDWEKNKGVFWQCDVNGENILHTNSSQPVIYVSWHDTVEYCGWLTKKFQTIFRLPSEAEWEYACRAGSSEMVYSGNIDFTNPKESTTLDEIAWYSGNCRAKESNGFFAENVLEKNNHIKQSGPKSVCQKKPNDLGLYDMIGNVWEWCSDWYDEEYYLISPEENPTGPEIGSRHVMRGGSWFSETRDARAAFRGGKLPDYRSYDIGFRICAGNF